MPKVRTAITYDSEFLRELFSLFEEAGVSSPQEQKWNWGRYQIDHLTREEAVAYFPHGRIRGIWTSNRDSQSDYTNAISTRSIPKEIKEVFDLLITNVKIKSVNLHWKSKYISNVEEPIESVAVTEQVEQETDTTADDISQWPSDQLASTIMQSAAETDMPRLRDMILTAEDTGFTVEQSEQLAPWLLNFAVRCRDNDDPQDEAAVWSAIRTGASMLPPQAANLLLPLLKPGHSIETSLVTVKMLGRIFEAQPPAEVDEYQNLANEALRIAESLLNRYAITVSQSAAMAQLAIYALAAMASSETQRVVETVQQLSVTWFTQQMLRELRELRTNWLSRPVPVADRPRQLLDRVILTLE